ncbi:MAG: DNA polymerase/3'-5' exonuclease PolX [Pseudomonadota bacterium]
MDKHHVANILYEMSQALEIKGDNPFRVRAYQNAARIIESLPGDLEQMLKSGELAEIKGIGSHLLDHIQEILKTGELKEHKHLMKSLPPGIFEMLKIQGVGPKKVAVLWKELAISNVGELEYACKENRLLELPGFGVKMQEKILAGIAYLKRFADQHLYETALFAAQKILEKIKKQKGVIKAEIAGSIRRHKEIVKDIDILVATKNPEPIMQAFVSLPEVESITAHGQTKSSVLLANGIAADLRAVTEEQFPFALHYFTGSKEHNVAMRALAKAKGLKLNEYGLFKKDKLLACKNEAELFKTLGLVYIPPELRENQGEIPAAARAKLPDLVEQKDLKGVFHVHSNWSDGLATILEMAKASQKIGYKYLGLSDHSRSAQYAGGLKPEDIKKQHQEIDEVNKKLKGFTVLKGIECDILADGSLDYPDSILKSFDFVIISIHSRFNMPEAEMTKRIIKGMQNPYAKILGHPTGRLLLAREGYKIDIPKIIEAAAKNKVAIEINAHPQRLDLDWRYGKFAKDKGVKIVISPDAHDAEGLQHMAYGLGIARKGWLEKSDILNCLPLDEVKKYFK